MVPRPSIGQPEAPAEVEQPTDGHREILPEVEEPTDVQPEIPAEVEQPSGGQREIPAEAEEPTDGQREAPAAVQELDGSGHREVPAGTHEPSGAQQAGEIPREPPGFQPRADLLARPDRAGPRVQVLHSVSGAGTTQLAAANARARLAEGWRLVAWVSAGDTGSMLRGLAAVADALGLSERGPAQDRIDPGEMVRRWLEADGERCLLVFDDVTDPEAVRPFIPADGGARVVITSHEQSDLGLPIAVGAFSAEEAVAFLARRTGLADDAAAAAVAAELGHLPLALALAAALIAWGNLGYDAYLDRLRTLPAGEDRAGPVRAVRLSLGAVPAGVCHRVLELISVLSGAGVRRDLLHAAGKAGLLGGRQPPAGVDAALDQLAGLSLLTFSLDGQTVIANGQVLRGVRDRLSRRRLAEVCRAAASLLGARARTLAGSSDRLAVRDVPGQVTALAEVARRASEADQGLARILLRLRFLALYHLIELGDSATQAIAVGEPLTADLERVLGPEHPDTLNARNSLAAAYQEAGRPAEAIPLFERTLVGLERLQGPEHPDTLTTQNNLAAAYQDAGRAGEARLLFELTLAARERLLGPNHPSTLNSRGNLAAAYRDTGRAAEAIRLFEQTLQGRESVLGASHPDTLSSRVNLAAAYREAGRVAEAIPLAEQILAARERQLGGSHPSTLNARNNLAAAYREAGRVAEAIPLLERTLEARERVLGRDHQDTVTTRKLLALAREDADRAAEG